MPTTCEIKLENETEPFIAGTHRVHGNIYLTTTSEKNVKDITITLYGGAKCRYAADCEYVAGDPNSGISGTIYTSTESFLSETNIVQSGGILPAGTHIWSFCFLLPHDMCPSSVEAEWGRIRYELYFCICNKDKYNNIFVKPISVLRQFDSEFLAYFETPQECEIDTTCSIILTRGKLFLNLKVPHSGYAPGEKLKYTLTLRNRTGPTAKAFEVKFIRKIKFVFTVPQPLAKYAETVLYKKVISNNAQGEMIADDVFIVPPTPPTTYTKTIHVDYLLRVKALMISTTADFKVELPIIISSTVIPGRDFHKIILTPTYPPVRKSDIIALRKFETAKPPEPPFIDQETEEMQLIRFFQPLYPLFCTI